MFSYHCFSAQFCLFFIIYFLRFVLFLFSSEMKAALKERESELAAVDQALELREAQLQHEFTVKEDLREAFEDYFLPLLEVYTGHKMRVLV